MDAAQYKEKVASLLEDPVYEKVKRDPTSATERKMLKEVRELEKKELIPKNLETSKHTTQAVQATKNPQSRSPTAPNSIMHQFPDLPSHQVHHHLDLPLHWTDNPLFSISSVLCMLCML